MLIHLILIFFCWHYCWCRFCFLDFSTKVTKLNKLWSMILLFLVHWRGRAWGSGVVPPGPGAEVIEINSRWRRRRWHGEITLTTVTNSYITSWGRVQGYTLTSRIDLGQEVYRSLEGLLTLLRFFTFVPTDKEVLNLRKNDVRESLNFVDPPKKC